jgi:iron complex outermembrane receptor protein
VLFTPLDLLARTGAYNSTSQSYELQLISPVDQLMNGRLDYVAGLYYFQEDFHIGEVFGLGADFCNTLAPAAARPACNASGRKADATVLDLDQDADNLAVYAQGDIGITDTMDVVIGARWTQDNKDGLFVQQRNNPFAAALRAPETVDLAVEDDAFTYRLGLNWTPNDDLLVFGSYSTGYKSGGFNSGGGAVALGQKRLFDKETAENYELGAKWTLADGRARLNSTIFQMDLSDFQDRAFDGTSFNVINAGNLRNRGLEISGDYAPVDWLTTYASIGYLDSEFSKYPNASCLPYSAQLDPLCVQDLEGERPVFAPELQGSLGAQVQGELGFVDVGYQLRGDASYIDDINVGQINDNNPQGIQEAYTLLSARFSLLFGANRNIELAIFGDNLSDEEYCVGSVAQPLDDRLGLRDAATGGTVMRCAVNPPRTYGISLKASF